LTVDNQAVTVLGEVTWTGTPWLTTTQSMLIGVGALPLLVVVAVLLRRRRRTRKHRRSGPTGRGTAGRGGREGEVAEYGGATVLPSGANSFGDSR
jgi:MYXO-CTERM domain-containing protein